MGAERVGREALTRKAINPVGRWTLAQTATPVRWAFRELCVSRWPEAAKGATAYTRGAGTAFRAGDKRKQRCGQVEGG